MKRGLSPLRIMFAVDRPYMAIVSLRYSPSMPTFWRVVFNHKWVLKFVKGFFCIYWDDHMVFIFQCVNMVYHIDWFAYIEESLHPWDKPHLTMMYDPFNVLLDSVCWNFVEDFCIYVQWYWPIFLFCVCGIFVWFWYHGLSLGVFLPLRFSGRVWARIGASSSLKFQ